MTSTNHTIENETVRYADFGAPKHNRNIHIEELLHNGHPAGIYHVGNEKHSRKHRRIFRMRIKPHTQAEHILWSGAAIILGVTVFYFLTEVLKVVIDKAVNLYI
jgi:hypothetical protein